MKDNLLMIGGGAAGLMAAVTAADRIGGNRVMVLERLPRVGKKILATGNGRCNLSNTHCAPDRFHSHDASFFLPALEAFSSEDTRAFFETLGVLTRVEENGKIYPYSGQAASVLDALRFACEERGVSLCCEEEVTRITASKTGFTVYASKTWEAGAVIVAAGGKASPHLGSNGSGYDLLRRFGHPITRLFPAIVQIKTDPAIPRQLTGIKWDCAATIEIDGNAARSETGEILFTNYGLSGPAALQLSRLAGEFGERSTVVLNLLPDFSRQALSTLLWKRAQSLSNRTLSDFLVGLLPKRLGQVALKTAGFSLSQPVSHLKSGGIRRMAAGLQALRLPVTGVMDFSGAQVTAGGLVTDKFDSNTLMSRLQPGLFAAGEILDVDGDCGGFNLQWAFSSGYTAALSAVQWLNASTC